MMRGSPPFGDAFAHGLRDSLPVGLALVPIGLAFGFLAQVNGIHWGLAGLMSAVVYAGPSQFLPMSLLAVGASLPAIVLATWILNLRHLLYASSLAPYLAGASRPRLLLLTHGLADGAYAVTIAHCRRSRRPERVDSYFLAAVIVSFVPWVSFSLVGAAPRRPPVGGDGGHRARRSRLAPGNPRRGLLGGTFQWTRRRSSS